MLKRKKKIEKPKLKKTEALKKSQYCPRGAFADDRRVHSKKFQVIWACRPANRGRRSPAEDRGNGVHKHRRRSFSSAPPPAAPESCPGAEDIAESTAARPLWAVIAGRREPLPPF